jgi:hypothetical protein
VKPVDTITNQSNRMPGLGEPVTHIAGRVRFIFYDETTHPAASPGLNPAARFGTMSTSPTENGRPARIGRKYRGGQIVVDRDTAFRSEFARDRWYG